MVSPDYHRRSECNGCRSVKITEIDKRLGEYRLIINTIPARVLDEKRLPCVSKSALILDLASKPGGDGAEFQDIKAYPYKRIKGDTHRAKGET